MSDITKTGEMGRPISPEFPEFFEVTAPADVRFRGSVARPCRAWRGPLQPFEDDSQAPLVARTLFADRPLDVHGGYLLPPEESVLLKPLAIEGLLVNMTEVFDLLVLQFEHTIDPWVFSLAPAISGIRFPAYPHLRGDRSVIFNGELFHGLCVYSAAEFNLNSFEQPMAAFMRQVSIFAGKHLIWERTKKLFALDGTQLHESPHSKNLYSDIPALSSTQRTPKLRTVWRGEWLGRSASNGAAHLLLDPDGPCWCGDGKSYRICCRPREARQFFGYRA